MKSRLWQTVGWVAKRSEAMKTMSGPISDVFTAGSPVCGLWSTLGTLPWYNCHWREDETRRWRTPSHQSYMAGKTSVLHWGRIRLKIFRKTIWFFSGTSFKSQSLEIWIWNFNTSLRRNLVLRGLMPCVHVSSHGWLASVRRGRSNVLWQWHCVTFGTTLNMKVRTWAQTKTPGRRSGQLFMRECQVQTDGLKVQKKLLKLDLHAPKTLPVDPVGPGGCGVKWSDLCSHHSRCGEIHQIPLGCRTVFSFLATG